MGEERIGLKARIGITRQRPLGQADGIDHPVWTKGIQRLGNPNAIPCRDPRKYLCRRKESSWIPRYLTMQRQAYFVSILQSQIEVATKETIAAENQDALHASISMARGCMPSQ